MPGVIIIISDRQRRRGWEESEWRVTDQRLIVWRLGWLCLLCYAGCHYTTQYSRDQHLPAKTEHKQYNTLNTLWRQTRKMFPISLSPGVAYMLFIMYSIRWFLYRVCYCFLFSISFIQNISENLKRFYWSETISGFEESQELPLKFEDIVDKYYDKMRPPRTGGKNDHILLYRNIKQLSKPYWLPWQGCMYKTDDNWPCSYQMSSVSTEVCGVLSQQCWMVIAMITLIISR